MHYPVCNATRINISFFYFRTISYCYYLLLVATLLSFIFVFKTQTHKHFKIEIFTYNHVYATIVVCLATVLLSQLSHNYEIYINHYCILTQNLNVIISFFFILTFCC